MHNLNLKKFIPSLIWNWEVETHPVFTENLKNIFCSVVGQLIFACLKSLFTYLELECQNATCFRGKFLKKNKKYARHFWRASKYCFSTLWISEKKLLILHKSSKIIDMRVVLWYTLICVFISTWKWGRKMDLNVERWCSMKEICEYLGVSRDTVLAWIEKREMPATKIGRLWKFKISEVDAWMKSGVAAEK